MPINLNGAADMSKLQAYVKSMKRDRGFADNKEHALINLVHQVGSLAKQTKLTWPSSSVANGHRDAIGQEIADILIFLVDIANQYGVSISEAVTKREKANNERAWAPQNRA